MFLTLTCAINIINISSVSSFTIPTSSSSHKVPSILQTKQSSKQILFSQSNPSSSQQASTGYNVSNDLPPSPSLPPKKTTQTERKIASIQKYARIPVWPAWNGAFLFFLSLLPFIPNSTIAKLEDKFGGRVCPNFFDSSDPSSSPSPFLMLVHHTHSFTSFDFLREFQKKVILPEGFPAHPHRGFITLTYCLKGGMIHRDSLGCKQTYGAQPRHGGNVAQWLVAGAGMLHEEMWDVDYDKDGWASQQELFQLWVNLPSKDKMATPRFSLLNDHDHNPMDLDLDADLGGDMDLDNISIPVMEKDNTKTLVLVGEYDNLRSNVETFSPMSILHVQMEPNSSWSMTLPSSYKTGIMYMRTGSAFCNTEYAEKQEIDTHYTATLTPYGGTFDVVAGGDGADFMFLAGEPLYEPVQAQGSMVMNSPEEINVAYNDYSRGKMGLPWDHNLTDEEWEMHVIKSPSVYK